MSFGITKECFPPASKCHNCERKRRGDILQKTETRETFQRCSGCHLLTYCDQDCQREHWMKVHKKHCNLLSGQKQVENTKHEENTCQLCVSKRFGLQTSGIEIFNITSPKTFCHIENMADALRIALSREFDFHEEGKTCKCSQEFACHLPFPLGELSGEYVATGFDEMVSHALKIVSALLFKRSADRTEATDLLHKLLGSRAKHWWCVLVTGVPRQIGVGSKLDFLSEPVEKLKVDFGPGNVWWKALKFSVEMIVSMNTMLGSESIDSRGLEDPKFGKLKQIHGHNLSQLKNQAVASEKNLWPKFKLWPMWEGNSLVIVLPAGTRCQSCKEFLAGRFNVALEELLVLDDSDSAEDNGMNKSDPILIPRVGEDGQVVAFCSLGTTPRCYKEFIDKDLKVNIYKNSRSQCMEELKTFLIRSRVCDTCFMQSLSSHRCSRCKAAQYCSEKCKLKDFQSFHKSVCVAWAKDGFRKITDAKQQKKKLKNTVDELFK